jgi:hypothetical protein
MPRLTQQEKDFIQESLDRTTSVPENNLDEDSATTGGAGSEVATSRKDAGDRTSRRHRNLERNIRFWANPIFWMSLIMVSASLFTGAVTWLDYRARTYLGDSIDWLVQQGLSEDFIKITKQAGMGWLPDFIRFYPYRWTAVGAVWVVAVAIILIIMFIDYQRHKEDK